jgi:hypothetical protein
MDSGQLHPHHLHDHLSPRFHAGAVGVGIMRHQKLPEGGALRVCLPSSSEPAFRQFEFCDGNSQ